jgi:hypothetical protein
MASSTVLQTDAVSPGHSEGWICGPRHFREQGMLEMARW